MLLAVSIFAGCTSQPPRASLEQLDAYRGYFLKDGAGEAASGAVQVTYLGTTTLLFDDGETQLMVDGFFSRPPLPKVVASEIETDTAAVDAALSRAKIDRLKALFVAHSHYDHALDIVYVARRTNATLYGSESTLNIGRGGGLSEPQMVLYEPGKEVAVGRFKVIVLPSKHSPSIPGVNDDLGEVIDAPLRQPAKATEYKEGGSFDLLIQYDEHSILVKPSANWIEGALDNTRAEVLFLGTGTLANQPDAFQNSYYDQTVARVRPRLVIPIHWDNFFLPLSDRLAPAADTPRGFEFLIGRLAADGIRFTVMQGYQRVILFEKEP
jgi:L-ascorbate metabolism protein UlaG (beta-lactamase superfamily)